MKQRGSTDILLGGIAAIQKFSLKMYLAQIKLIEL